MRRIDYPEDIQALKTEYLAIFNNHLGRMQDDWEDLRDELRSNDDNSPESSRLYPDNISEILTADYDLLVDIFIDYQEMVEVYGDGMKDLNGALERLFNYSTEGGTPPKFQPDISSFFMQHQKELKLDVCYYCELSYINSYGFSSIYMDVGEFLMGATRHQIERYVRRESGKKLAKGKYDKIMKLRETTGVNVSNIEDRFNHLDARWRDSPKKSEKVTGNLRNHFDLDHFLPKAKCPLVALSLMNFVPSCPVCNEKLKGEDILWGENEANRRNVLMKVSPNSSGYDLDSVAKLRLDDHGHGWLRAQEHPQDYTLEFKSSDPDYQNEIINEFHLDERYAYHKCEALRWHDLMNDYPPPRIKEMATALNGYKTEEQLRNDIFQNDYFEKYVRCFDKLRRDILGIG